MFTPATKAQSKLRMGISGASGSGKTRSALEIAKYLVPDGKIALVDTENNSARKYSDKVKFDDAKIIGDYHPNRAIEALEYAGSRYETVIIDSLSHFWNGKGGFLDLVDQEVKRMAARGGKQDSFAAWKQITPIYNSLVQAILSCPAHVIVCLRAKQTYSKEGGKVQKLGVEPEMRDGFSYELDIEGLLTENHDFVIGKTRCEALDGRVFNKPGKELADIVRGWLSDGEAPSSAIAAPSVVFVDLCANLGRQMRAAAGDIDVLNAVRAEAKKAKSDGLLSDADYLSLGKIYMEVKQS